VLVSKSLRRYQTSTVDVAVKRMIRSSMLAEKVNAKKIDWIPNGNAPEWASEWSIDAK
jgi:hypothetical protein